MEESNKIIRDIAEQEYKYGFTTDIDTETIRADWTKRSSGSYPARRRSPNG